MALLPLVGAVGIGAAGLRFGFVGRHSLREADVRALCTLVDVYKKVGIDIEEEDFKTVRHRYFMVRELIQAARPVLNWSDVREGLVQGLLVESAKRLDHVFLLFQHRVWKRHGDLAPHLPVTIISREWRNWVMGSFQHTNLLKSAARASIEMRVSWIDSVRDVTAGNTRDLRQTFCWDEGDEHSMLLVFRDFVKPVLLRILSTWSTYEIQQSFGDRLRSLQATLAQTVMNGIRFLEEVVCMDELSVCSRCLPSGQPPTDLQRLSHALRIFCMGKLPNVADVSRESVLDARTDHCAQSTGGTGVGEGTSWLSEYGGAQSRDLSFSEAEHVLTRVPAISSEQFLHRDGHQSWLAPSESYGLQKSRFGGFVREIVQFHVTVSLLARAAVLAGILGKFAYAGGELFLAAKIDREHVVQVLAFVSGLLRASQQAVADIGEAAQCGWEELRRKRLSNPWSNDTPLDHCRIALNARSDILNGFAEAIEIVRGLQSQVEGFSATSFHDSLSVSVTEYLREWKSTQEASSLASSTPAALPVAPTFAARGPEPFSKRQRSLEGESQAIPKARSNL
eukprot:TRINITY_DN64510_c0_g1_i1.p1 TRINITY_DN64510_c0_g1~~TRINITY_DN64510_c0_g1_i1.p1  ORF type:complete len:565 (+),score=51.40 TRINITY_DN64510_c0_g1_i1:41-1735(+)